MTTLSDWTKSRPGSRADAYARAVIRARGMLFWERLWRGLWPASGIAGLFVAAALFGLFAVLPGWLHAALLALTLFAIATALFQSFETTQLPRWGEGARRIERHTGLAHRPVSESLDRMAAGDTDVWARALWLAQRQRMESAAKSLRVGVPHPGLAARDPYGLRFAALLLVIIALFVAGPRAPARFVVALSPDLESGGVIPTMDAWIDPPAYTGEPPFYLAAAAHLHVPVNSILHVRAHGSAATPNLSFDGSDTGLRGFTGSNQEYAANLKLVQSGSVHVRAQGHRLGAWSFDVIPDSPPQITFAAPPARTKQDALKLIFTAGDDYGVVAARAIIVPVGRKARPHIVDLPLQQPSAKTLTQTTFSDLTADPYAGLRVTITLEAKDAAGQSGRSKPVTFILPAHIFTNPLARALVEQRQGLAASDINAKARVERALQALTIAPDMFYQDTPSIYLALRSTYWVLKHDRHGEAIPRAQQLLWETALALEHHGLSEAAAQLRALQQMLSQALAQGAPQDVINALMQRYQQALQQYLREMARNAQSGGEVPKDAKVLTPKDLQALLNAIQQLAQTGSREQAQQLLALLQNLLENMQMTASNGSGQESPQDKAARDAIGKLGQMMGQQRELLDKTLREKEGAGDPKDGGPQGLAKKQGDLKNSLGQLRKNLEGQGEKVPGSFGRAGQAMGNAQGSLGQKDMDSARGSEQGALDALKNGAGQLAQELMDREKGRGLNGERGANGGQEDPLGRPDAAHGPLAGSGVKVPDKSALERARDILKELRRRAAERGRPKAELDYYDRLLKEFQ